MNPNYPGGGGYGPPGGYGGPPPGYGGPPGYYGPPGYGPPGFGPPGFGPAGPPPEELRKKIELWFVLSIVSLFCGCGLFGIINIVNASGAKTAMNLGDYATAERKIGTARTLCIVGYALLPIMILLNVLSVAMRMH